MLNIVIPMAGEGIRFKNKGYTFPKPLIDINGKPMIQVVIENITPEVKHRFTFICRNEHLNGYALRNLFDLILPEYNLVGIDHVTEGAACTVLMAREYFDNDDELIISNSDQYIEQDIDKFVKDSRKRKLDGNIMTFSSSHPKWSYAKLNEKGLVVEVAEKIPISNNATVGIYYYRNGKIFADAAKEMIRKNVRVNNEFYVCPVYNEMIFSGMRVGIYGIDSSKMHGIGTPEDLEHFLKLKVLKKI